MPGREPSSVSAAFRRSRRRTATSTGSWTRIARRAADVVALTAVTLALGATPASAGRPPAAPPLRDVLARYERAIADPDAPDIVHAESVGTLSGAGLSGTFHSWEQGDDERTDENLGPRVERTLRLGGKLFAQDSNGNVRLLTGVLARRDLTERFIDSGAFAREPERCKARGRAVVDGVAVDEVDVTAAGGETETVDFDASRGLPIRIAYDDDDGRTSVDYSDWRTIGGRRFAFKSVESDGDHRFDTVQITSSVSLDTPIDPQVFAPLVSRRIDMAGADVAPLLWNGGHAYVAVRIGTHAYTFLLDTGAQDILIDKHVAADLRLRPIGALEASGASRTGGLQLVHLDELDVGAGRLHDLVVTTIDLGASTSGAFRIDGVLGYPFFAATTARIDVANRAMTFGPPGSLALSGERVPIELDRSFPEAQVVLDGTIAAPFIFDTGNAAEVLLYKPFVDRHGGIVPFTSVTRRSFGIGGETQSYRTSLDALEIGTTTIYHADTDVMLATGGAFADRFDAGNVGLGVLRNFVVTFDYANGAMYLEHGAAFDDGRARG